MPVLMGLPVIVHYFLTQGLAFIKKYPNICYRMYSCRSLLNEGWLPVFYTNLRDGCFFDLHSTLPRDASAIV
jgi:hypothetical protein